MLEKDIRLLLDKTHDFTCRTSVLVTQQEPTQVERDSMAGDSVIVCVQMEFPHSPTCNRNPCPPNCSVFFPLLLPHLHSPSISKNMNVAISS